ncbi:MAG: TAXI family TRAP transporter solute-binding subunit [Pseudomonadota bacterium]
MRNKELLIAYGLAVALAVAAFIVAYQYVGPALPKRIVISAGEEHGALHSLAKQYKTALVQHGVKVRIKLSRGSLHNVRRLARGNAHVAFVNGGAVSTIQRRNLTSLGSLFYEPLWVFYRGDHDKVRLPELSGSRIAVGGRESDTRILALRLLAKNGIDRNSAVLMPLSDESAVEALRIGDIDAAVMLALPSSPKVRALLVQENVRLMGFERASAYTRIYPYMAKVIIPQGAIDLKNNIPARDAALLATTVNLIAGKRLHPAMVDLLLDTATEIHGDAKLIEQKGEFPANRFLAFPLNMEAERYYREGPPFLRRHLPFRVSVFVERMGVMLLPTVWLIFLLMITPIIYRAWVRAKINRWFEILELADRSLRKDELTDHDKVGVEGKIKLIEGELDGLVLPGSLVSRANRLRDHMARIRGKIWADQFSAL